MTLENRSGIPWARILAEGAVIIISILLAFGIDAWWDRMLERREEGDAIEGLAGDFRENVAGLDETIRHHQETLDRLSRLAAMSPAELAAVPGDSADGFVFAIVAPWTFDRQDGTLDGLIASGALNVLRDVELRSDLLRWVALADDVAEEGADVRAIALRTIDRVAELGGPWQETSLGVTPELMEAIRHFPPPDFTVVAGDEELRRLMRQKRQRSIVYLAELIPLQEHAETVLHRIESR